MNTNCVTLLQVEADPNEAGAVADMLAINNGGATHLERYTFKLVHVSRLSAALARLAVGGVDVVLLDLWLPDSQGLDTLVRARARTLDVPILVLTDREDQALALKALQHGAQDYLLKRHLNSNMLARVLSFTIERYRLTAKLKQYTGKLQASEARLRTIIEKTVDGIVIVSRHGIVRFVNPAAVTLFGRQASDLLGQRCGFPLVTSKTTEHKIINKGGEEPVTVVEIRVVETEWHGEQVYLASLRDITERKRMEEAEKELMQMKDDFIASVSHQLRTPLHSIKGFLGLLLKGKVADAATQQEFLTRAAQDADRLLVLVNDLLDIARLESDYLDLNLETISINELISEALQGLQGLAQKKGISLHYSPPKIPSIVQADRHWLQQVLVNLVENAIKFSNPHSTIWLTEQVKKKAVMVKVIDQGPGIPPEVLPRLFSKFYQADSALKRSGQGSGLGLYISKKIIEAHKGRINVKSKLGQGSAFFFVLPVSPSSQEVDFEF